MDPQQLAMILQSLPPEVRMQLMNGMGGGQAQTNPNLMTNRQGQPLSPNAAGFAAAGQAAGAPDAWKATPAQALSNAFGGFAAGKRQQNAALGPQNQGQGPLMQILKMLQGQQSYGTSGFAQTPVMGPGGTMGGGV